MKSRGWPRARLCNAGHRTKVRTQSGFTLIEMLVALVIAGILFFVAMPGYRYAVIKSTRASARATLMDVVTRQEQYFIHHKRYAVALENLGLPPVLFIDGQGDAVDRESAAYRISLDLVDGSYHGVHASPLNGQDEDAACMTLSLSRIGVRSVSGTLAAERARCW